MLTILNARVQVDLGENVPHVTIEYSANVAVDHDIDALVSAVHTAALDHGLAAVDALRTRAAERAHYRIADGNSSFAFVAIHVRIGPRRDLEQKQTFIEALLDAAIAALTPTELAIAWSIELNEIDPNLRINMNNVRKAREAG